MNDQTQDNTAQTRSEVIRVFILATTIVIGSSTVEAFIIENRIEL